MSSLLHRLVTWFHPSDEFASETKEKMMDHEKAMSEYAAARASVASSASRLEQAVVLSRMRSTRFADFEKSIREKHDHAQRSHG